MEHSSKFFCIKVTSAVIGYQFFRAPLGWGGKEDSNPECTSNLPRRIVRSCNNSMDSNFQTLLPEHWRIERVLKVQVIPSGSGKCT